MTKNLKMSRRKNTYGMKDEPYLFPFDDITLKDMRLCAGLSQKAMAASLEMSLGHYQKIEQGLTPPRRRDMLAALMILHYFAVLDKPEKYNFRRRIRNTLFGQETLFKGAKNDENAKNT